MQCYSRADVHVKAVCFTDNMFSGLDVETGVETRSFNCSNAVAAPDDVDDVDDDDDDCTAFCGCVRKGSD